MLRRWLRWQRVGRGSTQHPLSAAPWSRLMRGGRVIGEAEQMPAVVEAATRARSLRGQRPARRLGARVRRRVRELVPLAAAASARGEWTKVQQEWAGGASAAREAVEKAEEARRCTRVAQAAAGQQRSRVERAAVSGRRQTEARKGEAEGASEHDWGSRRSVSTIGKGASARNAEGRASASTLG